MCILQKDTSVTCSKERMAIAKAAGLCFNCLVRHKVSQCTSKFSCWQCRMQHHTSLCHALTTNSRPTQHSQTQPGTLSHSSFDAAPSNSTSTSNVTQAPNLTSTNSNY